MPASSDQLRALYEARYRAFRHAAAAIVGDYEEAHDVVQGAFAQALAKRRQFKDGSLDAWVWRIVQRQAFDARAKAGRLQPLEQSFDLAIEEPEKDRELASAIAQLPPRQRLIVFLRYFADLSYAQIAACCGIDEGTVGAALSQAKDRLRTLLEHSEVQP